MTDARPDVGLVWGVKTSFLNYLGHTGDATTTVTGSAAPTASGKFYFAPAVAPPVDTTEETVTLRFLGGVQFHAHFGMLRVEIQDPWVTFSAEGSRLSIALHEPAKEAVRIPLLSLEPTVPTVASGVAMWTGVPSRLTTEGRFIFRDFYPADESFDPLTIRAFSQ
ncbi:hypothetical protein J2790_001900 [Paenarthrobacter nicotinovorans]|uniref:HtaA domain-containing protein n=1 Tax=Micrococcaceae TaxID=1268 RepID=UPI0008765546|nr:MULTISPECIES: HtaA domain-containing protein [Micrococcaceae]MDR6436779.1 hypothetical protein [Paenarthrobacter nicotinovorans]SCZ56641.1 Htaa protein [Arthrobacter sp. UNCCL28]